MELASAGVRVNAVAPGPTSTARRPGHHLAHRPGPRGRWRPAPHLMIYLSSLPSTATALTCTSASAGPHRGTGSDQRTLLQIARQVSDYR
ncbi:hypothetical protein [Promicromonospora sp. NPDC050262]|uniref:hypothetical protein n=1 Tax=Promicromonospora sp. NPDC050262 TaxID=3155036 RepID=UPI003410209C